MDKPLVTNVVEVDRLSTGSSKENKAPGSISVDCTAGGHNAGQKKRRKVDDTASSQTELKRLQRQQEREEKERLRQEKEEERERARNEKEEDRRRKEVERQAVKNSKMEERAEKQRKRDEEKWKKEEERLKKEQGNAKKEQSQMKLGAFFKSSHQQGTPPQSSIHSENVLTSTVMSVDYQAAFLPFYVKPGLEISRSRFHRDMETRVQIRNKMDGSLGSSNSFSANFMRVARGTSRLCIQELLEDLNNPLNNVDPSIVRQRINKSPRIHLQFAEDIRPPYSGTFSKCSPSVSGRRPLGRAAGIMNYEYDSEREWEQPEEDGEDILSEEEDASSDDDGEMMDFLDDDGVRIARPTTHFTMELIPLSIGVCWEDESIPDGLDAFRIRPLGHILPINPLTTPIDEHEFRTPQGRPNGADQNSTAAKVSDFKPIPSEFMPAFISSIDGQAGTAVFLNELLKQKFPQCTKKAIREQFKSIAEKANGVWHVKEPIKAQYA